MRASALARWTLSTGAGWFACQRLVFDCGAVTVTMLGGMFAAAAGRVFDGCLKGELVLQFWGECTLSQLHSPVSFLPHEQ